MITGSLLTYLTEQIILKHMAACQYVTTCPWLTHCWQHLLHIGWDYYSVKVQFLKRLSFRVIHAALLVFWWNTLQQGFSVSVLLRFGSCSFLLWGCPLSHRVLSSIPALYSLNVGSTLPLSCDNQICLQILPNVPWGTNSPLIENLYCTAKKIMMILQHHY